MPALLDHVFICTAVGAPAADQLRDFGLQEGSPNRHPGQGTACRRFFFQNAMLELLWVEDAAEAQSDQTRRTRLWDRWCARDQGASPFGIVLRPASQQQTQIPFPSWEDRPPSMPDLVLHIATGTELEEPMWCYIEVGRRPDEARPERRQPLEHPAGFRQITSVRIAGPVLDDAALTPAMARTGIIALQSGKEHLLELEFDGRPNANRTDFRPALPLVLCW